MSGETRQQCNMPNAGFSNVTNYKTHPKLLARETGSLMGLKTFSELRSIKMETKRCISSERIHSLAASNHPQSKVSLWYFG